MGLYSYVPIYLARLPVGRNHNLRRCTMFVAGLARVGEEIFAFMCPRYF
ncbi:Uncharacterised protein [Bordetella pertussis]|nr:Uncharacterised protein [Bordetella pertussis]CFM04126.1 Uncharacterised protein [Bordetella pertussis]CFN08305.1 Uncharacterised protein [Bordetella pertussis]CFN53909.1 Uncharacterised protein [Bordetella pertussis]CFN54058.1 Uncharacterised protein [Bordetella pertussis]